jgi:hypothetical protein
MLAAVLLAACPGGTPDPEQTTIDGRSVFLIQEAHCFLGDCVASFFANPRELLAELRLAAGMAS